MLLLVATSFAGVTVQSPSNTSVTSPVHFVATAASTHPITAMRIYVDGVSVFNNNSASLDTSVAIAAGQHTTVVQAWDSTGAVFKNSMVLTVGGSSSPTPTPTPSTSPTPAPTGATVKSDIDQMPGWENCTVCAGANAAGPSAVYSMAENVLSPALDGKSAQFNLAGSTPYSDALWWKQLGGNNAIKNFTYDVNFYITNPRRHRPWSLTLTSPTTFINSSSARNATSKMALNGTSGATLPATGFIPEFLALLPLPTPGTISPGSSSARLRRSFMFRLPMTALRIM